MKNYIREFCRRGLMWGASGGPLILALVWLCLYHSGVMNTLTVTEVVRGIFTVAVMGFIAAGISVIYLVESLPKTFAGLIQCLVLYVDYLGIYLINGWIPTKAIGIFTLIFLAVFAVIWLSVYLSSRRRVIEMNQKLGQ